MALSNAQLDQIAALLFLLKSPKPNPLPVPANTDDTTDPASLASKLEPISTDQRFNDLGIGVVDFTSSFTTPKVWLHNAEKSFRIASTGKLAILIAAVQLRDDVRKVMATGFITTRDEIDSLFSTIWTRSKDPAVRKISGAANTPRISTIFDVPTMPPNFVGAMVPLDKQKMSDIADATLEWTGVPDLSFWELLFLAAADSQNVAATACVSEIGVPYMKAIQRAYGLYDRGKGMHMLLGSGYAKVSTRTPVNRQANAPPFRNLTQTESNPVIDTFWEPPDMKPSRWSTQPGSADALTAYMLALMQDDPTQPQLINTEACDTIRTLLADETALNPPDRPRTDTSLILVGVNNVSAVTKAHTKLGILDPKRQQRQQGQVSIRAEFAYIETAGLRFAVLATGIQPKTIGGHRVSEVDRGTALGAAVFNALHGP
jgi:hypothetical protein